MVELGWINRGSSPEVECIGFKMDGVFEQPPNFTFTVSLGKMYNRWNYNGLEWRAGGTRTPDLLVRRRILPTTADNTNR
jgi:hypothetical protein